MEAAGDKAQRQIWSATDVKKLNCAGPGAHFVLIRKHSPGISHKWLCRVAWGVQHACNKRIVNLTNTRWMATATMRQPIIRSSGRTRRKAATASGGGNSSLALRPCTALARPERTPARCLMSLRKHGSNALHPQWGSITTCKTEGLGALGSLIGFNKTPVVRTITGRYITYGERKQLASI